MRYFQFYIDKHIKYDKDLYLISLSSRKTFYNKKKAF